MSSWSVWWRFWWGWLATISVVALALVGTYWLDEEGILLFLPMVLLLYPLQRYASWWMPFYMGNVALVRGQNAEAAQHFRTALEKGGFTEEDPRQLALILRLAEALAQMGEMAHAEALAARAHALWRRIAGPDHMLTLNAQVQWAMLLADLARFSHAEALLEDAAQRVQVQPASRIQVTTLATVLNNWAVVLTVQKKYSQAEALYRRVLEIETLNLKPTHLFFTMAYHNLAVICEKLDKLEEAERHLEAVKPLVERHFRRPNYLHASLRMVRGWIRFKQGRLQDADVLAQEAVRRMEQAVGVESPLVARPLYLLARVAQARDAWDDARLHASRSLRLRETYLPSEHPETNDARELVRELTGQASEQIIDRNRARSIEARETSPASL